jgi:beta-N-acetylhexosaminidase
MEAEHDVSYGRLFSFLIVGALAIGAAGRAHAAEDRSSPVENGGWKVAQAEAPYPAEPVEERQAPGDPTDPENENFLPDAVPDAEPEGEPFVDPEALYRQEEQARRTPASPGRPGAGEEEFTGDAPPLPERRKNLSPSAAPSRSAALPAQLLNPLGRMIGQMLMVGFNGISPDEQWTQRLSRQIHAGLMGGVIFMEQNIRNSRQVSRLTSMLQDSVHDRSKAHQLPLLVAVDQEGGVVQRLAREKGFGAYPSAEDLGRTDDPHRAYLIYKDMADELADNGFNFNLGPVVDLNLNAASPTIAGKSRSYGADPRRVIAYAKAFCYAHRDAGVLTALKHFPGHGSSAKDSHVGLVDLTATWTEAELEPYRMMVRDRVGDAVMVGHVFHPSFSDGKMAPASLSAMAIQRQLRGRLGYGGVVITDDLEMSAIRKNYGFDESLLRAIEAGADILLLTGGRDASPELAERAVTVIRQAVLSGRLSRDRIRASYEKVINLKRRLVRLEKKRRRRRVLARGPASPSARRAAPSHGPAPASVSSRPARAAGPQLPSQSQSQSQPEPRARSKPAARRRDAAQSQVSPSGGARRERDTRREDENFPF